MPRNNGKEIKMSNDLVTKSNEFSMSKLNHGLTLNQTQLLMYAILSTQKNGQKIESSFNKVDFEKQFGIREYRGATAKKDAGKLISLSFSTEDLDADKFKFYNVFQHIEYDAGTFEFKWTDYMLPHILDLKERYITTDLQLAAQFTSSFSWTLYDYLKANYGKWYIQLTKQGILNLFGVEDKKSYSNTALFKRSVLDIAVNEINELTELEISYEENVKGRAIVGFTLKWSIGQTKKVASDKQIEQIKMYIDTVFSDLMKYMTLKDSSRLIKARELILKIENYKQYIEPGVILTANEADRYISEIKPIFNELEFLVEKDAKGISEFYDWTKD